MDIGNVSINSHSSIRIGGSSVLWFDPFQLEDAPHDADIILVTHEHFDHFSPEDIVRVSNKDTFYVAPSGMGGKFMELGVSADHVVTIAPGEGATVRDARIRAVPAYNVGRQFHTKDKGWVGYLVTLDDVRYYVAGDTDALEENQSLECDVALVPVGGTYTMTAAEAAEFVVALGPKVAVPTHYGSVVGTPRDGQDFADLVDGRVEVRLLM